MGDQLRIFSLAIGNTDQVGYFFDSLSPEAKFNCLDLLKLWLEWESRGKCIGRLLIGDCSKILHFIVGWQ